jgi:hypothetical protein
MISQERAVNAEKVIRKVVKRPVGDDTDVLFAAESILAQKLHGTASENLVEGGGQQAAPRRVTFPSQGVIVILLLVS